MNGRLAAWKRGSVDHEARDGDGLLGAELVLLNLDRGAALLEADDFAARHQLEGGFIIELRGPTDGQLQLAAGDQKMIGAEQDAGTGNIDGPAVSRVFAAAFVEHAVTDFALDRKAIRVAPVGGGLVWVWVWIHVIIRVSFIRLYEFACARRFAQVIGRRFGHSTCVLAGLSACFRLSYHAPMSKLVSTVAALVLGVACLLTIGSAKDSKKNVVAPAGARPSPNYSAGIQVGDTLYVAGQTGSDPKTQKVPENFEDEVKQCLVNIGEILHAGKMDYSDVVAVQVYLTDMDLFQRMNAVYTGVFKEPRPTRTTVGVVKLAGAGAHIEITVTARK